MPRIVAFACGADRLIGTVDQAAGTTGVLIVSGGNEVRCGAHRGMALLSRRLAAAGVPSLRFDRRGVGDSEGENGGYATSGPDIAAAVSAFRREQPQVRRVVGFGNCDAATALLLFDDGCDALVLANPWLGDDDASPPPSAVRARYLRRLADRAAWRRAIGRGLQSMLKDVAAAIGSRPEQPLASRVAAQLGSRPTTVLLARGDRTAQVFADAVRAPGGAHVVTLDTDSHSFAGEDDALAQVVLDAVARLHDKGDR